MSNDVEHALLSVGSCPINRSFFSFDRCVLGTFSHWELWSFFSLGSKERSTFHFLTVSFFSHHVILRFAELFVNIKQTCWLQRPDAIIVVKENSNYRIPSSINSKFAEFLSASGWCSNKIFILLSSLIPHALVKYLKIAPGSRPVFPVRCCAQEDGSLLRYRIAMWQDRLVE